MSHYRQTNGQYKLYIVYIELYTECFAHLYGIPSQVFVEVYLKWVLRKKDVSTIRFWADKQKEASMQEKVEPAYTKGKVAFENSVKVWVLRI